MSLHITPFRCLLKNYPKDLPNISVVLIYLNEALSVIKRAVRSIITHTPKHLLKEIILVDDCSTYSEFKTWMCVRSAPWSWSTSVVLCRSLEPHFTVDCINHNSCCLTVDYLFRGPRKSLAWLHGRGSQRETWAHEESAAPATNGLGPVPDLRLGACHCWCCGHFGCAYWSHSGMVHASFELIEYFRE